MKLNLIRMRHIGLISLFITSVFMVSAQASTENNTKRMQQATSSFTEKAEDEGEEEEDKEKEKEKEPT